MSFDHQLVLCILKCFDTSIKLFTYLLSLLYNSQIVFKNAGPHIALKLAAIGCVDPPRGGGYTGILVMDGEVPKKIQLG